MWYDFPSCGLPLVAGSIVGLLRCIVDLRSKKVGFVKSIVLFLKPKYPVSDISSCLISSV